MAKKKAEKNEVDNQKKRAADFIKKFRETNALASVLTESRLSNIREYISSGSYTLNRVISGSYFKGWPNNRIYAVAGACVDGDTLITVEIDGVVKDISIQELYESV